MIFLKPYALITILLFSCNYDNSENDNSGLSSQKNISSHAPDLFADTATYLRVYVDPLEKITLNGNSISLTDLDYRFKDLKNRVILC